MLTVLFGLNEKSMTTIEQNGQTYRQIPIPVHPDDADLPISTVALKLPTGRVAWFSLPIQGVKTIENFQKTLDIWKDTIVCEPEQDFQI